MTPHQHMERAERGMLEEAHKRSMRYANELLALRCGPDLLALELFPDFKEVTESFGMFRIVQDVLGASLLRDPSVALVAVGDGCTPRTAATFAFRSSWSCHSVDPQLREGSRWVGVRGLSVHRCKVEQWKLVPWHSRCVLVAVHSHAALDAAVRACASASRVDVFAMPCCVGQELARQPNCVVTDKSIASPHRAVKVWLHYFSNSV